MNLTNEQIHAINCAYCDLVGVLQARNLKKARCGLPSKHDWKAHKETIKELEKAFSFIQPVQDLYEKGIPKK